MMNLQAEINQEIFRTSSVVLPARCLAAGKPIFYAYGCALLERCTDSSFVYTAVNLGNGQSELLRRSKNPLTANGVNAMAEKIRTSHVAGAGRLEAERSYGMSIALDKCKEILHTVFRKILPAYGYTVRKEQIALSENILNTIKSRNVSLCEAEVGTGKTHAYLAAAILAKRGRLIDFWNKGFYPKMSYADMAQMPIVVATSSIALQKAIVTDYIPELSHILLERGVIKTPLTSVLRKGKEHYICERNLRSRLLYEQDTKVKNILRKLLSPKASIDLAETDGLTPYVKRKIAIPNICSKNCPHRDKCAYLRFRSYANNPAIDVQVVNHNYFLADVLRRVNNQRSLIPNYQMVIIDEAHRFLSAARSMYGSELSCFDLPEIKDNVFNLRFKRAEAFKQAKKLAKKLYDENHKLFSVLNENSRDEDMDGEANRFPAVIDNEATRHLRNLRNISDTLYELLSSEEVKDSSGGRKSQIIWDLANTREQLAALTRHNERVCWLEKADEKTTEQETRLCAIPQDLDARLYKDLWGKGIPVVLTSGTLSAGGDFSHIKRTLGLEKLGGRLTEISKPSPFNYQDNVLLYISENTPFPDQSSKQYIVSIADEAEKLIKASQGHAAVLFTSYKVMDMVWELFKKRGLKFPVFRLDKGGVREIERFKASGNGILFASGSLWEGIDIPGDALSMLIIVKLPFAVPDPIGEYEQTLYKDMFEYKSKVVVPEMLVKLKQGFGRLIRTETDTGVIAILDSRAALGLPRNEVLWEEDEQRRGADARRQASEAERSLRGRGGAYRERVLNALPNCRMTAEIADVRGFIKAMKTPEYFK